jgi:RHH-type proline utilization regulon transcriptional repressor/proline dehydrogenase/delta 1-pyrroline-5-carboxylate dehydrogenase
MFPWVNKYLLAISANNFNDETALIQDFIQNLSNVNFSIIQQQTKECLEEIRKDKSKTLVESLITKFEIGTNEGSALMELAEALIRVPDKYTSYELIRDKISNDRCNWKSYIGKDNSSFVNSTARSLNLASKIISKSNNGFFASILRFVSEPIINKFARQGIAMIGNQFIMGQKLYEAISNSKKKYKNYIFSYDMLGEGARNAEQAEYYFNSYKNAVEELGAQVDKSIPLRKRNSLSIKISALHARYEFVNQDIVFGELFEKVKELVLLAAKFELNITIDAEECTRLVISLGLFEKIFALPELKNYNGLGLAVQSYNKSAIYTLDFLSDLAKRYNKEIPIRLVKGAYWDGEIKDAQVLGLKDFPVFTQKYHTDISYLYCAKKMLEEKYFYPQFASHNAFTAMAIIEMAKGRDFEIQRLHGMGDKLHNFLIKKYKLTSRIYAPVGTHEDLLAYLVRRILENGASTSFVHMFSSTDINIEDLIENPIDQALKNHCKANVKISSPSQIYINRLNSYGIDMGNVTQIEEMLTNLAQFKTKKWNDIGPLLNGKIEKKHDAEIRRIPGNLETIIGKVIMSTQNDCENAMKIALDYYPTWSKTSVQKRAEIANKMADLIEKNKFELTALIMHEMGKALGDCEGEIREGIDFCRYYANQAIKLFGNNIEIDKHHVGESNELTLHSRGVFICISPWNFPFAIFLGQVIAALLAGNCVIAKPSEQSCFTANFTVKLLLEAGLPPQAISLLPGTGSVVGKFLTSSKHIAGVVFTGSTETAKIIQKTVAEHNPSLIPIIAETGGQNCGIVDSTALLEQVVDEVMISSFNCTGQRCSALRVLYIQEDIYDKLINMLKGAMDLRKIGESIMHMDNDMGPIIDREAFDDINSYLIKVKDKIIHQSPLPEELRIKGFYIAPHLVELKNISELEKEIFGPVLHVISYKSEKPEDLNEIINQINSTGYNLTFGLFTRNDEKVKYVSQRIKAGNIYVNRSTVGAVVGVQPFGGSGLSGTGFKAGGPFYLLRFATEQCVTINTAAAKGVSELFV